MTTTKICTNGNCPGYARVIYTGATRCDFCRWDLKAAQRNIAPVATDAGQAAQPRSSIHASQLDAAAY